MCKYSKKKDEVISINKSNLNTYIFLNNKDTLSTFS